MTSTTHPDPSGAGGDPVAADGGPSGADADLSSSAPLLVVQHDPHVPVGRLPLQRTGLHLDVRRPDRGDPLPADLTAHSGLLVLGGTMAAWEDDVAPWLPATRALLAAATAEELPVLGICLGAQLLALATGGRVERGAAGPEVGLLPVTATAAGLGDPLTAPLAAADGWWLVPQAHGDAITAPPPDAEVLAASAAYPVQALRVGAGAWGVQYHPEATRADLESWLEDYAPSLDDQGVRAADVLALAAAREEELAALARHHADHLLAAVAARAAALRGPRGGLL
jgi:GMP synthase (glutamine-hydrolysing)